jgi:hypothetical protein
MLRWSEIAVEIELLFSMGITCEMLEQGKYFDYVAEEIIYDFVKHITNERRNGKIIVFVNGSICFILFLKIIYYNNYLKPKFHYSYLKFLNIFIYLNYFPQIL